MLDDRELRAIINNFDLISEALALLKDAVTNLHNRISALEND